MEAVAHARGQRFLIAFLAGLAFAWLAGVELAHAEEPEGADFGPKPVTVTLPPPGAVGFDISWPQCGGPYPAGPLAFGVVGVNHGKANTKNPCLRSQFRWAASGGATPGVYLNLNSPPKGTYSSLIGPGGRCRPGDAGCVAYNYGYNAAAFAMAYARSQGAVTSEWWLDVETMNTWSADVRVNARVIQGAIDYLQRKNASVGVYSTPYQWREIAGRYAPGLPVWTAGAESLAEAKSRCSPAYAFGGGRVVLVQYVEQFDTNYRCP